MGSAGALSLILCRQGNVFLIVVDVHGFPPWHVMTFEIKNLDVYITKKETYFFRTPQKMSFLPAIPLPYLKSKTVGYGKIAANIDGTLLASVESRQHCVYIYSVDSAGEHTADPIVFGTVFAPGNADGQLHIPSSACFVHRGGSGGDSLLICDYGNSRIVEVTVRGIFLRAIPLDMSPWSIAYSRTRDVIIVAGSQNFIQLQYESGALQPEFIPAEEQRPQNVTFTNDGDCILVADFTKHCVSKISALTGAFIAHVATREANGILHPQDVLECDDGSLLVLGVDGQMVKMILGLQLQHSFQYPFQQQPYSMCSSPLFGGVIVKCYDGSVFLLRDAWVHSSRCAWLSALCMP